VGKNPPEDREQLQKFPLNLKVTPDLRGYPQGKTRMCAILKENTANYIPLESLINVDFGKKYKLPVSYIPQKKIADNHENDQVSFN